MLVDSSKMSVMDISRFINESKTKREYKDFVIETDSYALMTKPMYERLIELQIGMKKAFAQRKDTENTGGMLNKC